MRAVEAVTDAGGDAAGPALALDRRRPGGLDGDQAVHPRGRIVLEAAGEAAIDNHPDPLDSEARFGDVGGQDDLSLPAWLNGTLLLGEGEIAVERMNGRLATLYRRDVLQVRSGPADLPAAGKEDEDVPGALRHGGVDGADYPFFPGFFTRPAYGGEVAFRHGKGPAGGGDHRGVAQQGGERSYVEGRRHDEEL